LDVRERPAVSGGLSQYNADRPLGPSTTAADPSARVDEGFITPDYADRYPEARAELAGWLRDRQLISHEQIIEGGARAFPDALLKLFGGENFGKLIIAVGRQPTDTI
jgi:NADPH-dependent curcumin reductase CurA